MSDKKVTYELNPTLESDLANIDEEKLPVVLEKRLELLEKTNQAYNVAKTKEEEARGKVAKALEHADALVEAAGNDGGHIAKTKKFLWKEWTSNSDEINALKKNLKEIIEHGKDSAVAQRELVEVQSALTESQTALLKVQETQMKYQSQIADATKFLYGLSAYNMASTQSVLINLKAVLSGASKEKLGEMAQQQLLLAMDQIKKQESIVLRIEENKELIDSLDFEVKQQGDAIKDLRKQDEEHDSLIEGLQKQDEEHDSLIEDLQKQDEEHDSLIEDLQKQDEEHDSLIEGLQKQDEEHDEMIEDLQKQDEEHDQMLETLEKKILELMEENKIIKSEIVSLKNQLSSLETTTSKIGWKVVVSVVAGGGLLLNLLQLFGVL